ncbi:beta-ketoacyl reductase, partial [Nonomuraea sp. NPDC047529]|uniref:type I polyketide synthase n=1 Tax=Nonomuraea sp. NPDC047529 TaxID=3155623 RepID=UPI00340BA1F0
PHPDGTTLITGGTGGLGSILARHLATHHHTRHLLLASRRGPHAPGADQLRQDLHTAGAHVDIIACDLSDPTQIAALLQRIPARHPLTAIYHTAGILNDATLTTLNPAQTDQVLQPKADAAWHLHQATTSLGLDLAQFVLYSSSAATLDSAGQGNYSAANAFLDALAVHRTRLGLPAQSLAWGMWDPRTGGMTHQLATHDLQRLTRSGFTAMDAHHGMNLLDTAQATPEPFLIPLPIDRRALATRPDGVPAILRALTPAPKRRTAEAAPAPETRTPLEQRLAGLPVAEQEQIVLSVVRSEVAAVVGHASGDQVDLDKSLSELGFDSLTSVELRNRLSQVTGLRLSATLVFDHPTAAAIAEHVGDQVLPKKESVESRAMHNLDELGRLLKEISADGEAATALTVRLQKLMDDWRGGRPQANKDGDVRTADADELFTMIDEGL